MYDAVRGYLMLAGGLTEVTRQRAVGAARALVSSGEATAEQVSGLAEDLLTTSRNNRDTILTLVRYEADRAMVRLGLATSEESAALAQRVTDLEADVAALQTALQRLEPQSAAEPEPPLAPQQAAPPRPTKRPAKIARKAPAKRSPAKRAPARRVAGSSPGAVSTPPALPDAGPEATPEPDADSG